MAGGGGETLELRPLQPGRADDEGEPGLRGDLGMQHRRLGRGEVESGVAAGEDLQRVVLDEDPRLGAAEELPEILADPRMARAFGDAAERRARVFLDRADEGAAHPA